jgi:hypothetical protein
MDRESDRHKMEALKHDIHKAFETLLFRVSAEMEAGKPPALVISDEELKGFIPDTVIQKFSKIPKKIQIVQESRHDNPYVVDLAVMVDGTDYLGIEISISPNHPGVVLLNDFHIDQDNVNRDSLVPEITEFFGKVKRYAEAMGAGILFDQTNDSEFAEEIERRGGGKLSLRKQRVKFPSFPFEDSDSDDLWALPLPQTQKEDSLH